MSRNHQSGWNDKNFLPRLAVETILEKDQGVCYDGHQCSLAWLPNDEYPDPVRICRERPHSLDGEDTDRDFYSMPLTRFDATPEEIAAVEATGNHNLADWARSTIADQS